jgi:hypothetical protein|tara:strand:- start:123463 stop:123702 length:240 start_codon:yes stop_codon:yes gene_type:complete
MRGYVPPDPAGGVSKEHFAVVYVPRSKRHRFAANCVSLCVDEEEALAKQEPASKRYAAIVLGPSKSSEGQFIYYLVQWL